MMKKIISTSKAPGAIGPYSQGVETSQMLFISGQLPINVETNQMEQGIVMQTNRSLANAKAIVEKAGYKMNDVVKATVFLSDMNNFSEMNEVYKTYFEKDFPARSAVEVARLPKDALVEIELIVMK
ncbi:MAG: RidA family protein [Clostridiales bacterium]|nr:RidA family protein [Clostridiales bacterium]